MSEPEKKVYASLFEEIESTEHGRRELAMADLDLQLEVFLERAVIESGMSNWDIASKMGVEVSRVAEVINGDCSTNLYEKLRYIYTLGFEVDLVLKPIGFQGEPSELERLNKKSTSRPRKVSAVKLSESGIYSSFNETKSI